MNYHIIVYHIFRAASPLCGRFSVRTHKNLRRILRRWRSIDENIASEPRKRFLNAGARQRKIHAQMAGAVKRPTILHNDANIPGCAQDVVNAAPMLRAPPAAIDKEHIGALWMRGAHA